MIPKVKVISGPPMSGKSTYIERRKGDNDLIYDFDLIMSAISGLPNHIHNDNLVSYVLDIRDLLIRKLKSEKQIDTAWFVTTNVTGKLKELFTGIDVEYIRLDVSAIEARDRLHANPDGRNIKVWENIIGRYFRRGEEYNAFYRKYAWEKKREEILKRDNFECQDCKGRGRYHKAECVHHIRPLELYPELGLEDDNLISLCNACHNKIHGRGFKKKEHKWAHDERW